jgi:predicted acylesterase/phospholipase RssA
VGNQSIGLCLSGGGHRASIFSLGALLYLVDAGRHRDIRAISSVSGGSLTSGFFAVQAKPIHLMDRAQFDSCAATWARQIAGSPAWYRTAFAVHALLFLIWVVLICMSWDWLPWLVHSITFNPPWWESQIGYLAAVCIWSGIVGRRPGGTLWGWWGTWLYLGILLPATFLLVFIWWSPLSWPWRMLIAVFAAGIIGARTHIADHALRATVFRNKQLRDIHSTLGYVFCTTEMQEGRHVFFARDFIYSYTAGLGQPADLRLSTAVQASANFPGAFPYRIFRIGKEHKFELGATPSYIGGRRWLTSLVLSDGGVQDNTGITWFVDAAERNDGLRQYLRWYTEPPFPSMLLQLHKSDCERIENQLIAMEHRPDLLVVINSSFAPSWRAARYHSIPVIGEIAALLDVQRVMYNHRGREQSRQLHRSFFNRSLAGAVVSIELYSQLFYESFADSDQVMQREAEQFLCREFGLLDLPHLLLQQYKRRAQIARSRQTHRREAKLAEVAARSRELEKRLEELQTQKAQAFPQLAEEERLEYEITKCKAEKREVNDSFLNEEAERKREGEEAGLSGQVPTTLRPLGVSATSVLLRHGYMNCMNICHLLQEGFPRFDDPPSPAEMQKLALGLPRGRYPSSSLQSVPFEG